MGMGGGKHAATYTASYTFQTLDDDRGMALKSGVCDATCYGACVSIMRPSWQAIFGVLFTFHLRPQTQIKAGRPPFLRCAPTVATDPRTP